MSCELPASFAVARTWNPERDPDTSANARLGADPTSTACGNLALVGKTLQTFQGLFIYTFDGEPIQLFT